MESTNSEQIATHSAEIRTLAETDGGNIHNPVPSWWQAKRVIQTADGDLLHVDYPDGIERVRMITVAADLPDWLDVAQTAVCLSALRRSGVQA